MPQYTVMAHGDEIIEVVIPNYSESLAVTASILHANGSPDRILDLGAGPGRISEVLHHSFPTAEFTLLDKYDEVLDIARERLAKLQMSVSYLVGDYTQVDLGTGYDAIIAGLTLHHLDDDGKQKMACRLRDALSEGGLLVIFDIVRGTTPSWDKRYENFWFSRLEELVPEDSEYIKQHYLDEDHPASIEDNLRWLREAGFDDAVCHWRYFNFAIWSGRKPPA